MPAFRATMRAGWALTVAVAVQANALAMANVDLGGVRVSPEHKLVLCGLEGNSLTQWTRYFIELEGGDSASAVRASPGDVWGHWEAACHDKRAPCHADNLPSGKDASANGWTSVLVVRSPLKRLASAYKKLCPRNSDGTVPEGFEATCPLFPTERPHSFAEYVRAVRDAHAKADRAGEGDPLAMAKLRPQSAACGFDPATFTHLLVEDDDGSFVGRVRGVMRGVGAPQELTDRYFPVGASFDKSNGKFADDDTASIVRGLYADDYELVESDAAHATAPPEPETSPSPAEAPDSFCVEMTTTAGSLMLRAEKAWAPIGVQRFWDLIQAGFYGEDGHGGVGIFRNAPGFVSQFGIHGVPEIARQWDANTIKDDPMVAGVGNYKGYVTFAKAGPNTRGSQLFVNLRNNNFLDLRGGFPPIARCIRDCHVADSFETKYGEGPRQDLIYREGNAYLQREFPGLDYVTGAKVSACPALPVRVRCDTTKGAIELDVHPAWAPNGAARLLRLVDEGYFNASVPLFRCLKGWICQLGGTRDPAVTRRVLGWGSVQDDPQWLDMSRSARPWMRKGLLSFAGSGPNSRWGELFFSTAGVNLGRSPWEVPVAELVPGRSFDVLDSFYSGYGELQRFGGHAPDQGKLLSQGGAYLDQFPDLDYVTGCARA